MDSVVTLSIKNNIAFIQMEDRLSKNTFTRPLIHGLIDTFKQINSSQEVKVVILYGYDNYFCCGGTKEELLNIFYGKVTFADLEFYRLLLDCPFPTIAAMQGHAIGGGLALGCYADLIILAEESIYSTNFMKYGFTPGMGATYIIPKKFGNCLGNEMLFTAKNYQGGTLKDRGISMEVVKKNVILEKALEQAQELASKPLDSLILLKQHLTKEIREILPEIIRLELEMHKKTFSKDEVKHRIENFW